MMFGPVLGQISEVKRNRCVYRCVCVCCCEGAGVRPGLVAAVCKGHGHRGVCFV